MRANDGSELFQQDIAVTIRRRLLGCVSERREYVVRHHGTCLSSHGGISSQSDTSQPRPAPPWGLPTARLGPGNGPRKCSASPSASNPQGLPWYDSGMKRSVKVAISLPPDLLARVDKDRRSSGASRSEVFRRALETLLQRERQEEEIERYIQGYRRHPDNEREFEEALATGLAALAEEPWK